MKHAKIYVIVLYKCEWNGREPYYQRKTGVQVYTNSLRQLLMEISESLPILSESGSEVSYFISKHRNFSEKTIIRRHQETLVKGKHESGS